MIGFVFGTLCLVGLMKVARHGAFSHHHAFGCGGSFGHGAHGWGYGPRHRSEGFGSYGSRGHGCDGRPGYGYDPGPSSYDRAFPDAFRAWGGGRRGRSFLLRALFEQLDATPGQEKAISAALEDLRRVRKDIQADLRTARTELATAFRSESFDEVALGGATARLEAAVEALRKAGIDAFAKIHGALDERQRSIVADWLERGPRGFAPWH